MGFAINTNTSALNSYRNLSNTQNDISKSLEKLSTGLRINRAADDAAGLALAEGLRSQVNGLNVAARNAQDGIGVIQTAEGSLTEVHSILQRVRDLAVQAGNDSNNADSRTAIKTEAAGLVEELGRIAESTNFNGNKLLTGDTSGPGKNGVMSFQVGANGANDQIVLDFTQNEGFDIKSLAASLQASIIDDDGFATAAKVTGTAAVAASDGPDGVAGNGDDVAGQAAVEGTIGILDAAITSVSSARSELGASQNRLEHSIKHINISAENLAASESRIRDADMAKEMASFTKSQIMSQAGTAMLAQANQINQGVLQLLG